MTPANAIALLNQAFMPVSSLRGENKVKVLGTTKGVVLEALSHGLTVQLLFKHAEQLQVHVSGLPTDLAQFQLLPKRVGEVHPRTGLCQIDSRDCWISEVPGVSQCEYLGEPTAYDKVVEQIITAACDASAEHDPVIVCFKPSAMPTDLHVCLQGRPVVLSKLDRTLPEGFLKFNA